jgi:hypothetical protein
VDVWFFCLMGELLGICCKLMFFCNLLCIVGTQFQVNMVIIFLLWGLSPWCVSRILFFVFWNFKAHKINVIVFFCILNLDSYTSHVSFPETWKMLVFICLTLLVSRVWGINLVGHDKVIPCMFNKCVG